MRRPVLILGALLAACSKPAPPPPPPEPPPPPPPINVASLAGTWDFQTRAEANDSVLVTYTITAGADASSWMLNLPNRKPTKLQLMAMGDSLMLDSEPYESVLRKGVKVKTQSVVHLVDGKLVGTTVGHYTTKGADSVAHFRITGTKKP